MHPLAVYHASPNNILEFLSICVVSDHRSHNQSAVHASLACALPLSKQSRLLLKKVLYFSDGAASQYKNYKAFINLCFHEQDHNLKAEWHLFARSHGKSPCDGVGGTVKQLVANASLEANHDMWILRPKQLYQWGTKNITGIFFFYVSSETVHGNSLKYDLDNSYCLANIADGTRSSQLYSNFFL